MSHGVGFREAHLSAVRISGHGNTQTLVKPRSLGDGGFVTALARWCVGRAFWCSCRDRTDTRTGRFPGWLMDAGRSMTRPHISWLFWRQAATSARQDRVIAVWRP